MPPYTYTTLDCAIFAPGDRDSRYPRGWSLVIPLPDGPDIHDDSQAAFLDADGPTMEYVITTTVKVLPAIGFRGILWIHDMSWMSVYATIDFRPEKPTLRCHHKYIARDFAGVKGAPR